MEHELNKATASPTPSSTAGDAPVLDDQHGNGKIDDQRDPDELSKKSSSQPKKVSSYKYIKEEKIAILSVLLDVGMDVWEMEKAINKPWRMLFWEQRVALPVREKLKSDARYSDIGFDVDRRFGGSSGIENLRKWVRSQKAQELERVEGERQRMPGSPPGRPLSEVQQLRARVFEEVTNATLEKDGDSAGDILGVAAGGDTRAIAAAAAAASATTAAGGGGSEGGRDACVETFAALFASPSQNGGGTAAATASAPIHGAGLANHIDFAGGTDGSGGAPSTPGGSPFSSTQGVGDSSSLTRQQQQQRQQQLQPHAPPANRSYVNKLLLPRPPGSTGTDSRGEMYTAAGNTAVVTQVVGAPRRRAASESTPEDFRLVVGSGVGGYSTAAAAAAAAAAASAATSAPCPKKKKVDHTHLVNRVMAQISTLNMPLAASALLVQALQAKIDASNATRGKERVGPAVAAPASGVHGGDGIPVQGEWGARGGGSILSLEERQLLLEERLQASREAESAQALAERRLKLMEEMRAAGNDQVVSDEVLQKQRRVVLGL